MNNQIPIYNGPIAVLDMLGFKNYVHINAIQTVIEEYAQVLTSASFAADVLNADLEFMVYSDTIAIRLIRDNEEGVYNFIRAIQLINCNYFYKCITSCFNSIPIRGAIAFGEYSWHKGDISTQVFSRESIVVKNVNFIVGQAVLDAHDLESKQSWIAIALTHETVESLKEQFPHTFLKLERENYILKYNIPLHDGTIEGYVINPTIRSTFKQSFFGFCEICNRILEEDLNRSVKEKYINTLKFLKYIYDANCLCPRLNENISNEIPIEQIDFNLYEEVVRKF